MGVVTLPVPMGSKDSLHKVSVCGVWRGDGTADVRLECEACEWWFADFSYPVLPELLMSRADAHRKAATVWAT